MNTLLQTLVVTGINLRSIPRRIGSSLVVCIGVGGVVAVLVTVLAMATGLEGVISQAARADRAMVLRGGALAEVLSTMSRDELAVVESAPGVRRGADGAPLVSAEVLLSVNLPRRKDGEPAALSIRGLTERAAAVRPEIVLLEGRMFRSGMNEIVVGRSARDEFRSLGVGDTASFHSADWRVVGIFATDGDVHESEALTDASTLMSAAQRTVFTAATVVLESPDAFAAFEAALERDPRLKVDVRREVDYYTERSKEVGGLLEIVATSVGAIMAIGALLGALNTMYSAVSARTVEIATLRAIGFGATPVVVSVLVEAQILALVGALAGSAIAWTLFNGNSFATGGTFGQIALRLEVGLPLVATGILWAFAIALVGGLLPAIRAARLPVATALRMT